MRNRTARPTPLVALIPAIAAALIVPVLVVPQLADPAMLPRATALWLCAIAALLGIAALVAAEGRDALPPRPRALVPVLVLVGWTAVAVAVDDTPVGSIVGSHGRYDGLATLVACAVLAAAVVVGTWRRPERLEALAVAVGVAGAIGFAWVLLERLGVRPVDWRLPAVHDAIIGIAGNPNFSGAHLAMVVPLLLAARARASSRRAAWALLGAAVALAVGVGWTSTAGGVLALVGGVAVASLLDGRVLPRAARVAAAVATVALLGGAVLALVVDDVPDRVPFASTLLDPSALDQRANIWSAGASMVADHPVVGVGPDDFGQEVASHRSSRGGRLLITADEAHDVPLDRAATAGLPALVAHLWLLAVVGLAAWRARGRIAEEHRWLLAAFGGLTAAYVLQSLVSIDALPLVATGWIGLGALVALADPSLVDARLAGEGRLTGRAPRPIPVPAVLAGAAVGLLLAVLALRPALADRAHRRAVVALAADRPLAALRHDRTATSWYGEEPTYRAATAQDLVAFAGRTSTDPELRRTLLDEAIVAYDQAAARAPGEVAIELARAQVHVLAAFAAADRSSAEDHLDQATSTYEDLLDRLPATDDLHLPYARVLIAEAGLGEPARSAPALEDAAAQLELAERYLDDRAAARLELARVRLAQGRRDEARAIASALREDAPPVEISEALVELEAQLDGGAG
ncbi:MAG: O-antigen ligase family protein [Acidimicrobiales bacterium]